MYVESEPIISQKSMEFQYIAPRKALFLEALGEISNSLPAETEKGDNEHNKSSEAGAKEV